MTVGKVHPYVFDFSFVRPFVRNGRTKVSGCHFIDIHQFKASWCCIWSFTLKSKYWAFELLWDWVSLHASNPCRTYCVSPHRRNNIKISIKSLLLDLSILAWSTTSNAHNFVQTGPYPQTSSSGVDPRSVTHDIRIVMWVAVTIALNHRFCSIWVWWKADIVFSVPFLFNCWGNYGSVVFQRIRIFAKDDRYVPNHFPDQLVNSSCWIDSIPKSFVT